MRTPGPFPPAGETAWQENAACRGSGSWPFFPEAGSRAGNTARIRSAKLACFSCGVRKECLEFALANFPTGIWAGTTERERRDIRRAIAGRKKQR